METSAAVPTSWQREARGAISTKIARREFFFMATFQFEIIQMFGLVSLNKTKSRTKRFRVPGHSWKETL